MSKTLLTVSVITILLILILLVPLVEVASANFKPELVPLIKSVSPSPNTIYNQNTIPLEVTVEMRRYAPSSYAFEQLVWMNYSIDGQPEVYASVTNTKRPDTSGIVGYNGFATGTLSGLADGAHSIYLHGQTTLTGYSFVPETSFNLTVYFVVDSVTPTMHVLSPQTKTYYSTSIPLEFTSDKQLSWSGYGLDQNLAVTTKTGTDLTGLSAGAHTLRVYGKDNAGNIFASQSVEFTVKDNEAPIINIDTAKIITASYGHPVVPHVNTTLLPVTCEVNEPTSKIYYSLDGYANRTIYSNESIAKVPFGNHTLIMFAFDGSGNVGVSQLWRFNLSIEPRQNMNVTIVKSIEGTFVLPSETPTAMPSETSKASQSRPYSALPIITTSAIIIVIVIVAGTILYTAKRKRLKVNAVQLFESGGSIFSSLFSFFLNQCIQVFSKFLKG
jgi:hypothetical protein